MSKTRVAIFGAMMFLLGFIVSQLIELKHKIRDLNKQLDSVTVAIDAIK